MVYYEEQKDIVVEYLSGNDELQEPLGKCPKCGNRVFSCKKMYFCEYNKVEGGTCGFGIFWETEGSIFTKTMSSSMLTGEILRDVPFFWRDGSTAIYYIEMEGEKKG